MSGAQRWHGLTAAIAIGALILQLALVLDGASVLAEEEPPSLGIRLAQLIAYFTIQSNLLVAAASVLLARDPQRDGPAFRALRLAGTVGITVTGLVHFVLLRPLLDLEGGSYVADKLLHMVVPALAVIGWTWFGPRARVDRDSVAVALAWPIGWVVIILLTAEVTGWAPYPFLDADAKGWAEVGVSCAGITVLFAVVIALMAFLDRRLSRPALSAPR